MPLGSLKQYFATKMQASSTQNGRDSIGRRLGVKKLGDHEVFPDDILIRQRGFKWHAGQNTYVGKDHTIHSKIEGKVRFDKKYTSSNRKVTTINVDPVQVRNVYKRTPPPYVYHPELFPERALNNPAPTNHVLSKAKPKQAKRTDLRGAKVDKVIGARITAIPEEFLKQQNHWDVKQDKGASIIEAMQKLESKLLGITFEVVPAEQDATSVETAATKE